MYTFIREAKGRVLSFFHVEGFPWRPLLSVVPGKFNTDVMLVSALDIDTEKAWFGSLGGRTPQKTPAPSLVSFGVAKLDEKTW